MKLNNREFFSEENLEAIPSEVFQDAIYYSEEMLFLCNELWKIFFEHGLNEGEPYTTEDDNYLIKVTRKPRVANLDQISKL